MICVIVVLVFIINNSDGSHTLNNHDNVVEIFVEKSGNSTTNYGSLREMTNSSSIEFMSHQRSQKSSPLIYRWQDGQRISGDKVSITPWDDYDFNGSKDYEYQLSYRGCQINKIEVRLLIVIFLHLFFISIHLI